MVVPGVAGASHPPHARVGHGHHLGPPSGAPTQRPDRTEAARHGPPSAAREACNSQVLTATANESTPHKQTKSNTTQNIIFCYIFQSRNKGKNLFLGLQVKKRNSVLGAPDERSLPQPFFPSVYKMSNCHL